jgi:hypothetical protein
MSWVKRGEMGDVADDLEQDSRTYPLMWVLEKKGGTHLFVGAEGSGFTRALCGVRPPLRKAVPITQSQSVLPFNPYVEAAKLVPTHWRKLSVMLGFVSCDTCLRLAKHGIKQAWQSHGLFEYISEEDREAIPTEG